MKTTLQRSAVVRWAALAGTFAIMAGCASGGSVPEAMQGEKVVLLGINEVPPVETTAAGGGTVTINPDRTVIVVIAVARMTATAAHIHEGAPGANGPVIVPLVKTGDNTFTAPEGAKLTDSQYASYKAGNLYINVHSANHPSGEVRAQLKGG